MDGFGVGIEGAFAHADDMCGLGEAARRAMSVVEYDIAGTILSANDLCLARLGATLGELVGRSHGLSRLGAAGTPTAARIEGDALWAEILAGGDGGGLYLRRDMSGGATYMRASHVLLRDAAGLPTRVVEFAIDATEGCLRQAELRSQVAAVEKSHAVIRFDISGLILDANDVFLDAMGYTLDEIRGRHHRIFVEPSHAHGPEYAAFWSALARGKHQSGQFCRLGRDGREVWLQATYNPIFSMDGAPVAIVKYASVVTGEKLRQAEHQGQIAAIHKAQGVISFDLDGTILDANDNFLDAMGYRLAGVRGRHHRIFVDGDVAESAAYRRFWAELAAGRHQSGEFKRVDRHGREVWLQASYNPILDMHGRPFRVVTYASVVTDEKLRRADDHGQIAAIRKSQAVISFALDGTILDANENFLAPLGYTLAEVEGRHHSLFVGADEAASDGYAEFWSRLRSGEFVSGLFKRVGRDGRIVWIQASYNPILDLNGKAFKIVKYATDVSKNVALAEAYEDARKQSQLDHATALPNRQRLLAFMRDVLSEPGRRLVLLYLDLDRFKPVNDTYGHDVGDHVLAQIADRLRRALTREQLAARLGGDEFVIAAPDLTDDEIARLGDHLVEQVSMPILHKGVEIRVGASIGVATSQDAAEADELLRCADIALYRSKAAHRGGVSFYASSLHDRLLAFRNLVREIRTGLEAGQFFVEFQPRFDTQDRSVRSVEALVRWNHPERGFVPPGDFIPAAEKSGLIGALGAWVLMEACRTVQQWEGIGVSVNVSPAQFVTEGDLVSLVTRVLEETGLDPERLELEVTESILLSDADRARATLTALKALGVRIAMDDFGTGYSSLSSLRTFPFDVIKIDRQFISDMDGREGGRETVQAILGLGRALGLSVTAEGVESEGQMDMLVADACTEVQGYLLARPMGADAITSLLAREASDD